MTDDIHCGELHYSSCDEGIQMMKCVHIKIMCCGSQWSLASYICFFFLSLPCLNILFFVCFVLGLEAEPIETL